MFSKQELLRIVEQIGFLSQKDVLDIPFLTQNSILTIVMQYPHMVNESRFCVIFTVTEQDLVSLHGFGEKTAQRLIKSISSARENVSFPRFLRAAGLNNLSETACACIVRNFACYEELKEQPALSAVQMLVEDGLDANSAKILLGGEFWENADLLRRFVSIA